MLKEKLMQDFKDAMKEKNDLKKNTIMMVRAAILQIEKDTQKEVLDNQIIEIMAKEVKKRKEYSEKFPKNNGKKRTKRVKQGERRIQKNRYLKMHWFR